MNNYGELKTEVSSFIHRNDLDSKMDVFTQLAEAMINKDLRVMEMEAIESTVSASTFIDFPAGYLEGRAVHVEVSGKRRVLQQMTPQQLDTMFSSSTGTPQAYAIHGGKMEVRPESSGSPAVTYTYDISYYKKVTTLAANGDTTTNEILTEYPLLYLSALLVQANAYVQDNEELQKWGSVYTEQVRQANKQSIGGRYILPTVR